MHHDTHDEHNKHFVCRGGCEGVSDKEGVCQAEGCAHHGKSLEVCNCKDDEHEAHEDVIVNM